MRYRNLSWGSLRRIREAAFVMPPRPQTLNEAESLGADVAYSAFFRGRSTN